MNCQAVKERLSEYADGMLPDAEASMVKDHLGHCPDCLGAYESMMKIIEHMNRMESVDEPAGFLESVNARLEKRFSLSGIFRRFFVPLRIKLPLELAGVATAAVLIFYLFGIRDDMKLYEITISPHDLVDKVDMEAVQIKVPEKSIRAEKKDPARGVTLEEKALEKGERSEEKGPEFGAALELKGPVISGKSEKKGDEVVSLEKKALEKGKRPEEKSREPASMLGEKGPVRGGRSDGRSDEIRYKITEGDKLEITESEKLEIEVKRAEPEGVPLQAVVDSLGGQVISTEYREGTEILLSLTIEIRADRYQDLLQELGRLSDIQKTSQEIPKDGSEIIKVKIFIQYSSP